MLHFEFYETDNGQARIYYKARLAGKPRQKALYCFQEEFRDLFCPYRCSLDGEPSHEIEPNNIIGTIEFPDESPMGKRFIQWAKKKELNFQPTPKKD